MREVLKQLLGEYPSTVVVVEGHADERGSAEYNLGLADRRATAAKEFLVAAGSFGGSPEAGELWQGAPAMY